MKEYLESKETILQQSNVDPKKGLASADKIASLREQYGINELSPPQRESILTKIGHTLRDVATIILLIAALISFTTAYLEGSGEIVEGILIIVIVIINSVLSIMQEGKAEKALAALQALNQSSTKVIRNGEIQSISAKDVVVGDILYLQNGAKIPADARLLVTTDLQVEEASLTGESLPIEKDADAIFYNEEELGDRLNMVYSGTTIVNGSGQAVVTAVGDATELGQIADFLNKEKKQLTPLQVKLKQLGRQISIFALIAAIGVMIIGLLQGLELMHVFMIAVSLAVAVVPETLPVIVTMTLAVGVRKMAERHAIIRRLPAVETLGTTSVIASDKTGTLTQNKMTVQKMWSAENDHIVNVAADEQVDPTAENLLKLAGLASNVHYDTDKGRLVGLPTEVALVAAMEQVIPLDEVTETYPRIFEIPFNSTRKRMTTVQRSPEGHYIAITKGAIDVLKPFIANGDIERAEAITHEFAGEALRVLAVTMKVFDELPEEELSEAFLETDLTLVGLFGMIDPPRPESASAVAEAKKAGIKTVMITGDHVATAAAIAKEIGILEDGDCALSGTELRAMPDDQLEANISQYAVFARVTPADKIRIIKAWQANDAVVAMTGDGVNDAPALKAADVGISMGITGTDVAREASDIILADDNFASIVSAIGQGRGSYDRVRRTINFLLSANISEVFLILAALAVGWGSPLLPIHILFINLVANGLPGFALSYENNDPENMQKMPLSKHAKLFDNGLGWQIFGNATIFTIVSLIAFYLGTHVKIGSLEPSEIVGQSLTFVVLSIISIIHVFNVRSKRSALTDRYKDNPLLVQMALLSIAITLAVVTIAPIANAFHLVVLPASYWMYAISLIVVPTIVVELGKAIWRVKAKQ
ncbi:cation-translocating P-type ATPase [Weissella muntiaci]|uniref:Cation-translocating P-type ATPase n=1 Tax=Weissella muntiaci TaxID=2508881 RepID=A0A6C2CA15_9LACO|nr:cation-translocating P-type ATPase [Weissella muntiaci]TYC50814.1 cation-translocating P-type ATPase [Weissella muntiaci]